MGEPVPGDIVDNIFLSVQQVNTAIGFTCKKGDFLIGGETSGYYKVVTAAISAVNLNEVVQSRVDVDVATTVVTAIEVLASPSYIYAGASGPILPGQSVGYSFDAATPYTATQTVVVSTNALAQLGGAIGRFVRKATDQAGNNSAAAGDTIIIKLGGTL